MRFVVKYLTRHPNDHVTVRREESEGDDLVFGRATECKAYLPDLRVSLKHARLFATTDRLVIEALGERDFGCDGQRVRRAHIARGKAAAIRIGPFLVGVEPYEGGEEASVTVELVDTQESPLLPSDEERIFTLKRSGLGKRLSAWTLFLAIALLFLAAPAAYFLAGPREIADAAPLPFAPDRVWLSGELTGAHGHLVSDCRTCHTAAFVPTRDEVCLDCHTGVRHHADLAEMAQAAPGSRGFDLMVERARAVAGLAPYRCGVCHKEHNGHENGALIPDRQAFCADCHRALSRTASAAELLDASDFGAAHPEFRPSVVVAPGPPAEIARVSLDAAPAERSGLKFPHDLHLDPDGKVARRAQSAYPPLGRDTRVDCDDCHALSEDGSSLRPVAMLADCAMCHKLDYGLAGDRFVGFPIDGLAVPSGIARTLPHGEPWQVRKAVEDYALAQELAPVTSGGERRMPGRDLSRPEERRLSVEEARRRAEGAVAEIFGDKGLCNYCHIVLPPDRQGTTEFAIPPVTLSARWMPHARFPHGPHVLTHGDEDARNANCETCHTARASKASSDVLLPGIASCRDCHQGGASTTKLASTCVMCHDYHGRDGEPAMGERRAEASPDAGR